MAKKRKVSISPIVDGVQNIDLTSWVEFSEYVNNTLPNPHDYIFRGQRRSSWKLEPSLDRAIKSLNQPVIVARYHLEQFQLSMRARRGVNPRRIDKEEEWWALGQHYGLWTPLLDWTESPFVALYFAFEEPNERQAAKRAVFALSRPLVQTKSASIAQQQQLQSPAMPDILDIIMPELDESARLISQGGLFTRSTPGVDVEKWVKKHFKGEKQREVLVKVVIPEKNGDRLDVLRALNRMNINHKSLFPDIGGSAKFCNMRLSIRGY
jgi:hypothetical protein